MSGSRTAVPVRQGSEQGGPPQNRELVFCHQCQNEWYRAEHGLTCPECQSEFTEIVSAETAPESAQSDLLRDEG
jgi:E3 ubiquitin-protein ligase RNF115/126